MERKKTREKMRRQEVNDKFNELMEALSEADSKGQTPAEKQQQKQQQQQAQAANIDKGNFRVDVLSRAVRVIKRLNEEVKTEHAEVERLRAQLEKTSFIKQELPAQEQQQQQEEEKTAVATPSSSSESNKPSNSSSTTSSSSSSSSSKLNPPMTWVTVPMWMPSGSNAGHAEHAAAMAHAKGMMLDPSNQNGGANGNTFPFGAMPFFVPHHAGQGHMQNGGMVGMPSMMMPASGGAMGMSMGFGGNSEGGMAVGMMNANGPPTSFAGGEVGEEEAPTHAPCA
jgi:hypothetical protein